MSALFHLYLCGRKAAEWLINMNEGVKFRLFGKSTSGQSIDLYATTNAKGVAVFEDVLIGTNYTLEEVDTAERYIVPDSQNAVIEWEKVTENDFYNELKRGDLKVTKTSEDGLVEGVKFHLYGTSLSGIAVDEYAVTNKNGVAMFEDQKVLYLWRFSGIISSYRVENSTKICRS